MRKPPEGLTGFGEVRSVEGKGGGGFLWWRITGVRVCGCSGVRTMRKRARG